MKNSWAEIKEEEEEEAPGPAKKLDRLKGQEIKFIL